jgi:L-alanine-DL-glutamate epimerase-like enolase superfamily enzyme
MKIAAIEDLHCDGGWRVHSFLKVTTDAGITGWSEYNESYGSAGVTAAIRALAPRLIGIDPAPVDVISQRLQQATRQAAGGINQQAIAAIENALLDVKGKALGLPVSALLGGPFRDRLDLYWSHCGTYRFRRAADVGAPPIATLDDVRALGADVAARGFRALKTNIFRFDAEQPYVYGSGAPAAGLPETNVDAALLAAIEAELNAFRSGAGPGMTIMLDLNFNFRTDGFIQVARAVEPFGLGWLELDLFDPAALAQLRRSARVPIGSGESLYGRAAFRPYLEQQALDVAVVDVVWNGFLEGLRIAALADAYSVNVAPHNFYGPLADLISAHFCAAIPNFRFMEIDGDAVPWKADLVTHPARIEAGRLVLNGRPGWGADVDEDAVRAHPVRLPR